MCEFSPQHTTRTLTVCYQVREAVNRKEEVQVRVSRSETPHWVMVHGGGGGCGCFLLHFFKVR